MATRTHVAAGVVVAALVSACAPVAEQTTRERAEAMGWPCGEGIVGIWRDPQGGLHAIVDDGREPSFSPATPATAECLRANGLTEPT